MKRIITLLPFITLLIWLGTSVDIWYNPKDPFSFWGMEIKAIYNLLLVSIQVGLAIIAHKSSNPLLRLKLLWLSAVLLGITVLSLLFR